MYLPILFIWFLSIVGSPDSFDTAKEITLPKTV
jgi:hypothetical protein